MHIGIDQSTGNSNIVLNSQCPAVGCTSPRRKQFCVENIAVPTLNVSKNQNPRFWQYCSYVKTLQRVGISMFSNFLALHSERTTNKKGISHMGHFRNRASSHHDNELEKT